MLFEVTKHFVRLTRDGMTNHATGLTEEQQGPLFLAVGQRVLVATGKPVNRRIRKGQGELKLRNRFPKHVKVNRIPVFHFRERFAKKLSILINLIEPPQHLGANVKVVSDKVKSGHLDAFCRWNKRLSH